MQCNSNYVIVQNGVTLKKYYNNINEELHTGHILHQYIIPFLGRDLKFRGD